MKKERFFWGIILLAVALLLILNSLGVTLGLPESIPIWRIILGTLFLSFAIHSIAKRRIFPTVFAFTFTVMLFETEIAMLCGRDSGDLASFWVFILIALLLSIGLKLLLPGKRHIKPLAGAQTRYIDCNTQINESINNQMSSCEVFFTNTEGYNGNGHINIDNNMGSLVIHAPNDWYVISDMENHMGSINIPNNNVDSCKRLDLHGKNNMGAVAIKYVKTR